MGGSELLKEFRSVYLTYDVTNFRASPDDAPYKWKYEARENIVNFICKVDSAYNSFSGSELYVFSDVLAILHVMLGINYIETEENQSGEAELVYAMRYLINRLGVTDTQLPLRTSATSMCKTLTTKTSILQPLLEDEVGGYVPMLPSSSSILDSSLTFIDYVSLAIVAIEGCNYLSLLYSGWDNHPRALKLLLAAKQVFDAIYALQNTFLRVCINKHENQNETDHNEETCRFPLTVHCNTLLHRPFTDHTGQELPDDLFTVTKVALDQLDSLFTHTLFYFAQVCGHLQDPQASAFFVATTLSRQLLEQQVSQLLNGSETLDTNTTYNLKDGNENEALGPDWSKGVSSASLNRLEWVRNALKLGQYFFSIDQLSRAALYYYAAETMLGVYIGNLRKLNSTSEPNNVPYNLSDDILVQSESLDISITDIESNEIALPDQVSRLLGEIAIHWGNLFSDMLYSLYISKIEEEDAISVTSDPSNMSVIATNSEMNADQKPGIGELYKPKKGLSTSQVSFVQSDPFFTGPLISFHRDNVTNRERFVGEGIDRVDLDKVCQEGNMVLLLEQQLKFLSDEKVKFRQCGADQSSEDVIYSFVQNYIDLSKNHITSYGPQKLGNLESPGQVNMSSLLTFPNLERMGTYEDAKSLFKASINAFTRGVRYFSFDGHVSEYILCQSSIAKLYDYITPWESNYKRLSAIHVKRATSLVHIVDTLNPNIFAASIMQLSLDIANAFAAAFEVRLQLFNCPQNSVEKKPYNHKDILDIAQEAISYYQRFFLCFKDSRIPNPPISLNDENPTPISSSVELSEGNMLPYFKAQFRVARILSGVIHESVQEKVRFAELAIQRFKWILQYAPKLLGSEKHVFATELHICEQMVELLPQKISFLHRGIDLSG